MSETCKVGVHHGPFGIHPCGRPAKGIGKRFGQDMEMCGIHLSAIQRSKENDEKRRAQWAENDKARAAARALSAARDELVRAAVAHVAVLEDPSALKHPFKYLKACDRLIAAVATLKKLEGK